MLESFLDKPFAGLAPNVVWDKHTQSSNENPFGLTGNAVNRTFQAFYFKPLRDPERSDNSSDPCRKLIHSASRYIAIGQLGAAGGAVMEKKSAERPTLNSDSGRH